MDLPDTFAEGTTLGSLTCVGQCKLDTGEISFERTEIIEGDPVVAPHWIRILLEDL